MTARRIRLQEVQRPRLVTQGEMVYYLGMSPNRFADQAAALKAAGLPQPDPLFGLWDLDAIDRWLNARRSAPFRGLDGPTGPAQAEPDLDSLIESYGKN